MNALKGLGQLVCPEDVSCMLCAAEKGMGNGTGLCDKCLRTLDKYDGERDIEGFTLYAAYVYSGAVATLIHGLKYENKRYMALPLIRGLVETYGVNGLASDAIVPVPLHKKRRKQRGFNQSVLLGQGLCEHTGIPLWCDVLTRIRDTGQQVGLSEEDRWQNVYDAFSCTINLEGKRVVLVDDVCTTGATMLACARTLAGLGARVTLLCAATVSGCNS